MISRILGLGALLLLVGLTATAVFFHRANGRMRARIAALPRPGASGQSLQAANEQMQAVIAQAQATGGDGAQAIHAELLRVRNQVAEMVQRAELRHTQLQAQSASEAELLANNRDPLKGLVRPEHFQDFGQATPTAAFQTLVWAAAKNNEAALAKLIHFSEPAQAKAEAMIAAMSPDARSQWTPDKLATLFFGSVITDVSGVSITSEVTPDAQHATVAFRVPEVDEAKTRADFQLGPQGWQVIITDQQMDALQRRLARSSGPPSVGR
jgi:hypothetical protein